MSLFADRAPRLIAHGLAAVLLAGLAAPLATARPAPPPAETGIAVFGRACLSTTPMTREGLASIAREQGWRAVSSDTPEGYDWRDVYRAGAYVVHLDHHRVTFESMGELICVAAIGSAPRGWKDKVSAFQANGAPVGAPDDYDHNVYQMPPELELTVWDLPDDSRIHALREPDNNLELSVNYPTGH